MTFIFYSQNSSHYIIYYLPFPKINQVSTHFINLSIHFINLSSPPAFSHINKMNQTMSQQCPLKKFVADQHINHQLNHGKLSPSNQNLYKNIQYISRYSRQTQQLLLGWNRNPNLPNIITFESFPRLQLLTLSGNNIESLQIFCRLYTPCLTKLECAQNNIVSVRCLKKCNWPELISIIISSGKQLRQGFSECKWPKLQTYFEEGIQGKYLIKVIKSQFSLAITSSTHSYSKMEKVLHRRFPNLDI